MTHDPPAIEDELACLLMRAKRQGGEAVEAFLTRVQEPVRLFLRRRLQNPHLEPFVDDVTAEVLLRVFRHFPKCQATTDREIVAWVLKIAQNEALRLLQRHPFRYGILLGDRDPAELSHSSPDGRRRFPQAGTYEPTPEDAPTSSEGMGALLGVLESAEREIDPSLRHLLYLRLLEGASWLEVGATLQISPSAAKRRFQRAQVALARRVRAGLEQLSSPKRDAALNLLRKFDAP